ncbi:MAG: glycosyltransferase family 2 protein [Rhodobacteraceae bacterium]|nr:glycosyltransferase family 2 protein [Paracoccaceae bacterium]
MDKAKAPCAALTMVRGEDFFLARWLEHYRRFLPDEHIYVLNHGADPKVTEIARGVNVIGLPYDETRKSVNQRRWQILSQFTSGLTQFYNWVICNDVDELVVLDPEQGDNLLDYLLERRKARAAPVLIPFAIEMVHVPELEPEPLCPGEPIIGKRRIYRLNSNYAKPCITSVPLDFKPGGHGSTVHKFKIDPHLYNFHLRFVDYGMCMARLDKSLHRRLEGKSPEEIAAMTKAGWGWNSAAQTFDALSKRHPEAETIDHPAFRKKMIEDKILRDPFVLMGGGRPAHSYRLPPRFSGVF